VAGLQHVPREQLATVTERDGLLTKVKIDAETIKPEEPIALCFSCDAYCRFDVEHEITRSAVQILHEHGHQVSVRTKGGTRALRDLDLFGPDDEFGATLTFANDADSRKWEPGALRRPRASAPFFHNCLFLEGQTRPISALQNQAFTVHDSGRFLEGRRVSFNRRPGIWRSPKYKVNVWRKPLWPCAQRGDPLEVTLSSSCRGASTPRHHFKYFKRGVLAMK
jgi:hypothetical protein